jgi:hypothetical protein
MTPTEIATMARQIYNAVGDDFFADALMYNFMYGAQLEAALDSQCIENVYTASSVANQQQYSFPTNAIGIKNLKYGNKELDKISQQEYDSISYGQSTVASGTPRAYWQWGESIYLYPMPDTSTTGTIQIFTYDKPQAVTALSTLEIPSQFHVDIVHYCVAQMFSMDQNTAMADRYQARWDSAKERIKKWQQKKRRGDKLAMTQRDDITPASARLFRWW